MKLIAINTIGLTGAEILCAELARHPEIRMLPGQNFIRFKNTVYRLHDYAGTQPADIFEMLSMHHYTRSGKCWSGLTKSMSDALRESYPRAQHKEAFVGSLSHRDFPQVVLHYLQTYYQSSGDDLASARYGGWFGNNIAINAAGYHDFDRHAVVINFSNPIDFWLGNINQRFVWDNLVTIKFWIVNELFLRHYARDRKNYLSIDIREYSLTPDAVSQRLRQFLDLPADVALAENAPDGFIRFSQGLVDKIECDAASLVPIYQDHALYKMASRLEEWADGFLEDPRHVALLEKYRDFWNTSSHTNLDWIGPVEEEIIELALAHTGFRTERNLSCWFYHDCFELTCDHFDSPRSKLEHYLGCLEDEIALPALAYYARVAVCYLESIVGNTKRRPYSAFPIRLTSLYRRLTDPSYAKFFPLWAMTDKVEALERGIDEVEQQMSNYYPVREEARA